VVCLSQRADGASWSLIMAAAQAVLTSAVFLLSIRRGEGGLSPADVLMITLAGSGMIGWIVADEPVIATACVVAADLIAAAMMVPKTYRDPGSETLATFALASLDGLYRGWLDNPDFRPIVDQDLLDGQHRNADPVGRPEFFTTAYFHTPDGLSGEIERAGFTGVAVYGAEGPGWPLRQEWADPQRREQVLFAARSVERQPSLIGFSHHLIAAAAKPWKTPAKGQCRGRSGDRVLSTSCRRGRRYPRRRVGRSAWRGATAACWRASPEALR
jgi:hypothetical protein